MKTGGLTLAVIGVILGLIGVFWGSVVGFYESERLTVYGLIGGGLLLVAIGSRMVSSTKPAKVEWTPTFAPEESAHAVGTHHIGRAVATSEQPEPPIADVEAVDDATVAVPRRVRRAMWSLELPDGSTATVRDSAVLGRAPEPQEDAPKGELVVVRDPSVSKSHAIVRLTSAGLEVCDLGSANGSVISTDRADTECQPGQWMLVSDGAILELGTAEVRCSAVTRKEFSP